MNIMTSLNESLQQTVTYLKAQGINEARVGIVLGTGLNALAGTIAVEKTIPYAEIPNFPTSTVTFHKGQLLWGTLAGVKVLALQGRFHYYEGYSMQQITFPVRVMKEMGVEVLLLSNAAGGLNLSFRKGDLIITDDHINLLPDNPLRGIGEEGGNRFVDMSQPYDAGLQRLAEEALKEQGLAVKKGVYVSVMGPNLETRAEYRWLRNTGGDMVGMSTVPEVIVANQAGLRCSAISVITDECDPDNLKPVNIAEIIEVAGKADQKLSKVMESIVRSLKM
jgi:purine-nucleoside phosphorylase